MIKSEKIRYSENSAQATLWQFKKVIETGDVRFLLILDDYSDLPDIDIGDLSKAWYQIYQDFSDAAGGNRADLYLVKQRQLLSMQLNLEVSSKVLRVVQMIPCEKTIEIAKEHGYNIDLKDFDNSFEKAYVQVKRIENQIKSIQAQMNEGQEQTDMDQLVVALEKYQGYQFHEKEMTVKKFANIYKSFKNGKD